MRTAFQPGFRAWGPYSKTYLGYSHVPALAQPGAGHPLPLQVRSAARFDCVVVPALHSSLQPMPNTTVAGTCHPWLNTGEDLSHVQYRWQMGMGPREDAYGEVDFQCLNEDEVLIRTRLFNNTARSLDCVLNYFMTMTYPYPRVGKALIAPGVRYIPGEVPCAVRFAKPRPWDRQQPDAMVQGVLTDAAFTDGFGFGDRTATGHVPQLALQPWGLEPGDSVVFPLDGREAQAASRVLAIRYRTVPARPTKGLGDFARQAAGGVQEEAPHLEDVSLHLSGAARGRVTLPASGGLRIQVVGPGEDGFAWSTESSLTLTAAGAPSGLEIDCLLVGSAEAVAQCAFEPRHLMPAPHTLRAHSQGYDLHYPWQPAGYRLTPIDAVVRQRVVPSGCLEDAEPMRVSNPHFTFDDLTQPFSSSFPRKRSAEGLWVNIVEPRLVVASRDSLTRYALLRFLPQGEGAQQEQPNDARQALITHAFGRHTGKSLAARVPDLANRLRQNPPMLPGAPAAIQRGMGLLRATLLQNTVYPIYTKEGWIVHFTPGKRWDNLYTWDGGFIALGLLPVNRRLAEYMLDLYLAPEDDPQQAFVHHGSPVPVQLMALRELVSLSEPEEQRRLLGRYYERARLFYLFLMGRTHGSTTARFETGLLSTYDYFYSSSGMDDYPAQLHTHLRGLAGRVAPAITASQAMLCAMTLRLLAVRYADLTDDAALRHGLRQHMKAYQADFRRLQEVLGLHAWDEESGYYGFVVHDEQGRKLDILRDEEGNNLNCGFDGVYPMVAGGGRAPHQHRLLAHLKSSDELLTPYGLTAVSQRAAYFSLDGYWNGGVWYPHAWYFGRALLDCGEGDFLHDLVCRQLEAWCRQANKRWSSFEMLRLASGEGAWHHSFSGLTSPLLNWAQSLYAPGTVTTGLATLLVEARRPAPDSWVLRLRCAGTAWGFHLWLVTGDDKAPPCAAWRSVSPSIGGEETPAEVLVRVGTQLEGSSQGKAWQPLACDAKLLAPGLLQLQVG